MRMLSICKHIQSLRYKSARKRVQLPSRALFLITSATGAAVDEAYLLSLEVNIQGLLRHYRLIKLNNNL